ncbi:hypothetical protein ZEAMMB73_Zm00001d007744 [Zea mays]|uniref:Uncharacterized protein n=1 Tax=Zea mays TaxID=4577 RepID=A0A1D6F8I6_MAIZE|nr:hypothetical protein ZEAMMB73_Zm00001d007744 [Zea mays]
MSSVVRAPRGGGSPVVAQAAPAGDVAYSDGGLDAKVRLSIGKPRRRGVGRRLTLAPAPAGHDVPGVDFGFGTSVGSSAAWMGTGVRKMAARRPWRGPLPPARVSPHLTLADVLARARTFHGHGGRGHAPGVLSAHASAFSPAPSGVSAGRRSDSSFLASRPGTRDLGDRSVCQAVGPGRVILLCVEGRKAHFTFMDGLCGLFANAGRPRCLSSPARAPPGGVHSLASAIQVAASSTLEPVVVQAVFEAKTKAVVAMDRRGAGGHGRCSDRDVAGQGRGGGHGVDPGLLHGGGGGEFQGSNLGFDPGYGAPVLALEHGVNTEEKIRKMANEIMDMVVDMTLDFCVDKVIAEEDGEHLEGAADGISIDMVVESPTDCPMKVVNGGSLDGVLVDKLPAAFSVVGGVSDDDMLVAAAGIKEVASQPKRSSPRLAGGADHHILEKAKLRAAWRNLDGPEFEHFDNDEVDKYESENLALGHLGGDFLEEVMDEDNDHLSCDFHTAFKKNKSKGSSRSKGSTKIKFVKKHKRCTK